MLFQHERYATNKVLTLTTTVSNLQPYSVSLLKEQVQEMVNPEINRYLHTGREETLYTEVCVRYEIKKKASTRKNREPNVEVQ